MTGNQSNFFLALYIQLYDYYFIWIISFFRKLRPDLRKTIFVCLFNIISCLFKVMTRDYIRYFPFKS